ncbi:MAG TPA: DUF418 domain-containing protein [Rhizomicrobium sp.]|nr:DUF418 domain-containing protein [Rhizomicrobium sp.]
MPPSKRISSIDALRGIALFGVLAINLEHAFRVSIFERFLPGSMDRGVDVAIDAFLYVFIDLKAFALFSLLFGLGLAMQYDRLATHARRAELLIRRLLALLAFGVIHLFLIWNGDILTEYAVAGLIVLPVLFGPTWLLGVAAAGCLLIYIIMPLLPPPVSFPAEAGLASLVQAANHAYGTGSFRAVLAFRIHEVSSIFPLHVFIMPRTLGLFMLGAVIWRTGLVRNADHHSGALWTAAALLIGIGLAFTLGTSARWFSGWPSLGWLDGPATQASTIILPLGYGALVLAIGTIDRGRFLGWFEPIGRLAFTNYVTQSVLLGWIFYGYGLGLFGKIGPANGMMLVVAVYLGQMLLSFWWLKRFRYGPLEWLWRGLTYGERPLFRVA